MNRPRGRGAVVCTWLLACVGLWQCSLDSSGRATSTTGPIGAAGQPGGAAGEGGVQGGPGAGRSGVGGGGGDGGAGSDAGNGGATAAGGAAGEASGAGGGSGGAGTAGAGAAGAGGGPPPTCDADKSEFAVKSAPDSCFFLIGGASKSVPPSKQTTWSYDEAYFDCIALGASLAVLADEQEYIDVRAVIASHAPVDVGTGSAWIGAKTLADPLVLTPPQLAASFQWVNGEPWAYNTPSDLPWSSNEPSSTKNESCVYMRGDFGAAHLMNNAVCATKARFALCERPLVAPALPPGSVDERRGP
ncbi:MAG TPA: C-type lectin domain-containing protein [Polyangiaceae bacterium]|nr:C-type lectin domain-containing protein [Polyangiaceae bacterium]